MFYQLRRLDGSKDPLSAGTWIDKIGKSTHLDADDVEIEITDFWDSPLGGRYPSGWQVNVPGIDVHVRVWPATPRPQCHVPSHSRPTTAHTPTSEMNGGI